MTTENAVPFKAILIQNDAEPEIRRFSVSKDVVTNFMYLKQKLTMIFPSLKDTPFIICWKDPEGDRVQIWSDEELIIALTEMEGDSKKLYVIPSQNYCAHNTSDPLEKAVHFGVTCDACERQVVGFRYKCAFCPNYDLCQNCEARGIHREHYMVRIPVPVQRDIEFGKKMMKGLFKFNRHSMKAERECKRGGGGHHGGHKHGGPGRHCPFMPPSQPCSSANTGHGDAQEDSSGQFSRSIFEQGLPINVEGIIESVMHGLLRMAGADLPAETSEQQQPASTTSENGNPSQQQQAPQSNKQQTQPTPNVSFQTPAQSSSSLQGATAASATPSVESSTSIPGATPVQDTQDSQSSMGKTWTFLNKDDLDEVSKQVQNKNGFLNGGGDMQPQQQPANPQQAIPLPAAGSSQQQQQSQQPGLYPHLEQSSSKVSSNPAQSKIDESLNRMLSMGFNNEDDFLRQVLIAKNGNIEQVLDMLLPRRHI